MILSIGEILVDIFDDGSTRTTFPGGAPFNVACNIGHFSNKEVCFYGAVGKDEHGKFLLDFAEQKVNHLYVEELDEYHTTEAIVTLSEGERSFRFNRENGADFHLSIKKLKEIDLSKVSIVHIGSLMLSFKEGRDFFYEAVKYLKAFKKIKISFDVNYRDDIFESEEEAKAIFKDALSYADIIKFTSEELELLTGETDLQKSLEKLLKKDQIAVVTLGKDGSVFYSKDKFIQVATFPLKPVDTTGAGDAFYSYFLYELDKGLKLKKFVDIYHALRKANVVGGLATQKMGAIDVVPSLQEIEEFLEKHK